MRRAFWMGLAVLCIGLFGIPAEAAVEWDPVSDAEKSLRTNPIDPGAGAVVLFKRGMISVDEQGRSWHTRIQTYTRIKILTEAGKEAANISFEAPKYVRLSKVEGR